ncbi:MULTISPECIES: hypothetical protein [unclassified Ensifer]|uniref:hypothetical protein n=1 Tax=unclassified Ensifer TaxID=2633371 RepID=UPI00130147B9|nr:MULTISPECIES: hypothetical protein [unclassified Ensifer]MBD9490055.1 hypothetical protein [Ensifer sp. ENS11]MDP9632555.1 hypothetical protein [Ensifer adhaerens]
MIGAFLIFDVKLKGEKKTGSKQAWLSSGGTIGHREDTRSGQLEQGSPKKRRWAS